jgi:serine/threonine protein phosphatase PrpC
MKTANKSDVGHIRAINEDRALVESDLNGFSLAIVADGMGGHQAGDIASSMAIDLILSQLQSIHQGMTPEERASALQAAVLHANTQVFARATIDEQFHGMGTTVVVAVASRELLTIAHIGDSRAYIINNELIYQLTEDHSLVNELLKTGQITSEQATNHPRRNVLMRALGTDQHVEVDVQHVEWKDGDILLLCSDGLSGLVDQRQMHDILRQNVDLEKKANELVQSALNAGGDDNITVVLLSNERDEMRCDTG